jgi:5-methylcytosine-specific restriction endonuclease McrA
MPSRDPKKRRLYQKRHYGNNREYYAKKRAIRAAKIVEQLHLLKLTLHCALCPESDEVALDFHHFDPSKKEFAIYRVASSGVGWKKVVIELEKCVCLCANCHRKVHKHKSWAKKVSKKMLIAVPDELRIV